ncbi:hypothetical protein H6F42_20520 [Pseudanabaena sp. FACHB-1998]|uniref:hypothetical protein n=1 Tax=Pseudanabaena sp. FACHB-1998 TaxID=2692858 RepID=UPI0016816C49|nr:hypothetical protein [Pseudanabaena sp. FACHB-1998]MBD2179312.1 hypothetical protein [Pseudanabaena sp. FACHB-1998]
MNKLNRKLITTLGLGWLGFGIVGSAITFALPPTQITILIDRSFCPQDKWQAIASTYNDIYQQHQNRDLQIKEVITFSDIGQEVLSAIPTPDAVRSLNTYGRSNQERQKQLQTSYQQAKLLSCQSQ